MKRSAVRTLPVLTLAAIALALSPSCQSIKKGWDATAESTRHIVGQVADGTGSLARGATGVFRRGQGRDVEFTIRRGDSEGTILIALDDEAAPAHAENFRKLVRDGYYDGMRVHRVLSNQLIQMGDPRSRDTRARAVWGVGGPGYTLPAEINLPHQRGSVAMARLGDRVNPTRESNGSQFYIAVRPLPALDGSHTVFGQVIGGMEWVDALARTSTDGNDVPTRDIIITSARLVDSERARSTDETAAAAERPAAAPAVKTATTEERKPGFVTRLIERVW